MNSISVKYLSLWLIVIFCPATGYSQANENRIFEHSSIQISEISGNTILSEFAPAIIQDSLYFITLNDKLLTNNTLRPKERGIYHLYKTALDSLGNATGRREAVTKFTTPFNDGPVSYCSKTGELFMTQNYNNQTDTLKPFQTEFNRLRIIIAKWINGKWEPTADFPYNNPKYSVGHPAITDSGDILIFSSDKPGGYGETDLYYSVRKNGKWKNPVNLGHRINTKGKEQFPFITDDQFNGKILIFSSDTRSGKGDFDLFYTRYPSDFRDINRFESPINSEYDDFAMAISPNHNYGYLTSNRPGTGSDDIYKFNFKREIKQQPQPITQTDESYRTITVLDNKSMRPIQGVKIVSCDKLIFISDSDGKVRNLPCKFIECDLVATISGYYDKVKILKECTDNREKLNDIILMDEKGNFASQNTEIGFGLDHKDKKVSSNSSSPKADSIPKNSNSSKIGSVPAVNTTLTTSAKSSQYYLILASFNKKSEASESVRQLISEGYEAIHCSESAPFRVGLGYSDLNKAKAELEVLKKKFKGSWIMKR